MTEEQFFGKELAACKIDAIPGMIEFDIPVHGDNRGWFKENFQKEKMVPLGFPESFFAEGKLQNNVSFSRKNVLRGLHAEPWDKYISVADEGKVLGSWVDLREGDSFGHVYQAVIDASKGVEAQTRKLFKVCAMRHIPVFTFINKMDREARDIFDLLDEIEKELGIPTCPVNWPIGSGKQFAGVYDRKSQKIDLFEDTMKGTKMGTMKEIALDDPEISNYVTDEAREVLEEEIELLDGASAEFDQELVDAGELSPVFFGSALMNFGVENFLNYFLKMTSSPLPRTSDQGTIDPIEEKDFSAFVFKIQANMNKAHRDRIAFMRICSGEFESAHAGR